MIDAFFKVFCIIRGQDIEEILSWRPFILRILIREVHHELGILFEHRVNVIDRELIVVRNGDVLDCPLLEQMLLAREHVLEEILVNYRFIG